MPDRSEAVGLSATVGKILKGLATARRIADAETSKLSEIYRKDKFLSSLTVPGFSISDVEIELRFAVASPAEEQRDAGASDVMVHLSPSSLVELGPQSVSTLKLKLSPIDLRSLEEGR